MPYFQREPLIYEQTEDYANPAAPLQHRTETVWIHPLAEVVGALRGAGLALDWLHEHPRVSWRMFGCLVRDAAGLWTWPDRPWLPLAYSLAAVRP